MRIVPGLELVGTVVQLVASSYTDRTTATLIPVKVKVTLRPTISRPVRLGVRRPSGTRDQFFFLHEISFRQLLLFCSALSDESTGL
jgi:hypothetical protein